MDWRERLTAVGLVPAHGGTGTWRDRWDRLIEIDWQAERFVYRCAAAERPAAFTPGMSYPLELLVTTDLCPPERGHPLWCAACGAKRVSGLEVESGVYEPCAVCGVLDSATSPVVPEPRPVNLRQPRKPGLIQKSLF